MKRITTALLATVVGAGLMSSAYAADLIIEEPVEVGVVDVSDSWDGAYIGVHVGAGWGTVDITDVTGGDGGDIDDIESYDLAGWLAGVQAGANFQMDSIVFGIEGDIAWTDISGDSGDLDEDILETNVNWLGTVRGRLGFAADAFLIYGTAGVAFAGVDSTLIDTWDDPDNVITETGTRVGWVAGIGAEAMVTEDLSLKAEFLYHDFGSEDFDFGGEEGTGSLAVSTVKVGLNWHF
jgi:outer membrane immunogenic protein